MRSIAERVLPRTAKLEVLRTSRIVAHGGVSERPKERASKARVGETQPWVQIPPPPPVICESYVLESKRLIFEYMVLVGYQRYLL